MYLRYKIGNRITIVTMSEFNVETKSNFNVATALKFQQWNNVKMSTSIQVPSWTGLEKALMHMLVPLTCRKTRLYKVGRLGPAFGWDCVNRGLVSQHVWGTVQIPRSCLKVAENRSKFCQLFTSNDAVSMRVKHSRAERKTIHKQNVHHSTFKSNQNSTSFQQWDTTTFVQR